MLFNIGDRVKIVGWFGHREGGWIGSIISLGEEHCGVRCDNFEYNSPSDKHTIPKRYLKIDQAVGPINQE